MKILFLRKANFFVFVFVTCMLKSYVITYAQLNIPNLVTPGNLSTSQSPAITLDWNAVTSATDYEYLLGTNPSLTGSSVVQVSGTSQAGVANLLFGNTYYWQVRAIKTTAPVDSSSWSPIWSFTVLDNVDLVSPVDMSINQSTDVLLDWSPVTGVTNYDYELDTVNTFSSPLLFSSSVGNTSQVNTNQLRFGTTYYWRIRARHQNDTTAWSAVRSFTTLDIVYLVSPVDQAIYQTPDVLLDWSPLSGVTNYDYELDTVNTFSSPILFSSSVGNTSQVYTNQLRFGTTYYWRIRARHLNDTTQWSEVRSFITLDTVYLVSPVDQAIYQTPDVLLDWSPLSGVTNYDYEWDTVNTFSSPLLFSSSVGNTSQVYANQLRFGTTYYWRVRARHQIDTTQWSDVRSFTTLDIVYLVAPVDLAIYQTPDVLLDWSPFTGVTNYDYEWDTVNTFSSPLLFSSSVGNTSQVYTNQLRFGTTYYWRVRARHQIDTTQWSDVRSFTTIDIVFLVAPANQATFQTPDVLLDWSSFTGVSNYDYEIDTVSTFSSPLLFSSSVGTSSQVYPYQLYFGTTFYWRVRARHQSDTTQWSAVNSFTTLSEIYLVSPVNGAVSISLNPLIDWAGITGVNGYEYRYSDNSNFQNAFSGTVSGTSQATLNNLSYGTLYYWQVRAYHVNDTSDWSAPWAFTTLYQLTSAPSLISPANTSVNIPVTGTGLQWTTITGATTYQYQIDTFSSFTNPQVGNSITGNAVTASLNSGTNYYWRARAGNGSGYSPWSTTWVFTTEIVTSLNEISFNEAKVFPNPASQFIIVKLPNVQKEESYDIIDVSGRIIKTGKITSSSEKVDISGLDNGIYFFRSSDNQLYKLLIEK